MTAADGGATLRYEKVTKRYGATVALHDVSLEVQKGEFLTLLGASGSGKSTMLMLAAGFQALSSGEIYVAGEPMNGIPPYRRRLGIVFQNYALFPHLSVFENAAFALRNLRWRKRDIEARVTELLALVGLDTLAGRMPAELSGGQQQRVALVRALAFRPSVLLLDEPLSALDKRLRSQMLQEFQRIHSALGTTMVFVTHDQEEALAMSDRIAIMNLGEIVRVGTPRELYEDPGEHFVAEFLGDANFLVGTAIGNRKLLVAPDWTIGLPPIAPGSGRLRIAVRPEKIGIGRPEPGSNAAAGTVTSVLYLGALTTYTIMLKAGIPIVVKQFNHSKSVDFRPGSEVTIFWFPDDSRVVGRDDTYVPGEDPDMGTPAGRCEHQPVQPHQPRTVSCI